MSSNARPERSRDSLRQRNRRPDRLMWHAVLSFIQNLHRNVLRADLNRPSGAHARQHLHALSVSLANMWLGAIRVSPRCRRAYGQRASRAPALAPAVQSDSGRRPMNHSKPRDSAYNLHYLFRSAKIHARVVSAGGAASRAAARCPDQRALTGQRVEQRNASQGDSSAPHLQRVRIKPDSPRDAPRDRSLPPRHGARRSVRYRCAAPSTAWCRYSRAARARTPTLLRATRAG